MAENYHFSSSDEQRQGSVEMSPLVKACKKNDMPLVLEILTQGSSINDATFLKALDVSINNGNSEFILLLLDRCQININSKLAEGKTLLHYIVESGCEIATKYFLKKGCRVNIADDKGNTPLDVAIKIKNVELVKCLLKFQATSRNPILLHSVVDLYSGEVIRLLADDIIDVDSVTGQGRTALHIAAKTGVAEVVESLIEIGANVSKKCLEGRTSLHYAAEAGCITNIEKILAKGSDINGSDNLGLTPLHLASQRGRFKNVILLLKNGASVDSISNGGLTPLHYASMNDHLSIVKTLLENGAGVSKTTLEGLTPLSLALIAGNRSVSNELVKFGASINFNATYRPLNVAAVNGIESAAAKILQEDSKFINEKDDDGKTPLFIACEKGHLGVVKVLIKHRAQLDAICTSDSLTPMHVAAQNGFAKVINFLMLAGANPAINDSSGNYPLHLAVINGHSGVVKNLDCDKNLINMKNGDGNSPIHLACLFKKIEILDILSKKGADISMKNQLGNSAVHLAAGLGFMTAMTGVLNNCSFNEIGEGGMTPLHFAASGDQHEMVEYLIDKGVNVNVSDANGLTPLHHAAVFGCINSIKMLRKKGANLNQKSLKGSRTFTNRFNEKIFKKYDNDTAMHLAARIDDDELSNQTVLALISAGGKINDVNGQQRTPLHFSSHKGHFKTSDTLLRFGANAQAKDMNGMVPSYQVRQN